MSLSAESANAQANAVTQQPASRATKIMSQFDFDPKIVGEVYDAVLTAKAKGQSQTEVFEKFAKKYNITGALKTKIEQVMSAAK